VSRRKRYDTEQLVSEIKADRRNTILLAATAVAIVLVLVIVFAALRDDEDLPEMKAATTPTVTDVANKPTGEQEPTEEPTLEKAEEPAPEAKAEAEEQPPDEPEAAPPPSAIKLALTKKGKLWINGKLIGKKVRKHSMTLAPGTHTVKAKIGRRNVKGKFDVVAGKNYTVRVDHKRKRVVAKVSK
jgi:type IV secretory pathway VirB10-like protein